MLAFAAHIVVKSNGIIEQPSLPVAGEVAVREQSRRLSGNTCSLPGNSSGNNEFRRNEYPIGQIKVSGPENAFTASHLPGMKRQFRQPLATGTHKDFRGHACLSSSLRGSSRHHDTTPYRRPAHQISDRLVATPLQSSQKPETRTQQLENRNQKIETWR